LDVPTSLSLSLALTVRPRPAIIDRSESQLVAEFTSNSHRRVENNVGSKASKPRGVIRFSSTYQSFSQEDDEDPTDDVDPEDNILPFQKRDSIEVHFVDKENHRLELLLKEQVVSFSIALTFYKNERFKVRQEVYLRNLVNSGANDVA
jgi:hypothetical protein